MVDIQRTASVIAQTDLAIRPFDEQQEGDTSKRVELKDIKEKWDANKNHRDVDVLMLPSQEEEEEEVEGVYDNYDEDEDSGVYDDVDNDIDDDCDDVNDVYGNVNDNYRDDNDEAPEPGLPPTACFAAGTPATYLPPRSWQRISFRGMAAHPEGWTLFDSWHSNKTCSSISPHRLDVAVAD
ncbi:hypothetical protein PoB_001287900 [Plakobranchus ocellatus]|uniref:Uncharacterized protein n=1 Tax=Plakobranchus ocellatus TaxID=259542 RepID=A0AAV3YWD8_9GAST|nr:hypothetical protein PoB_001287900 [Plakobranchus ocellatus]